MKGILLSGGAGTRLYPLTQVIGKQLQPVYDKPMIYYPLTTLIECGIMDLCLISTPEEIETYRRLLVDGRRFGVNLTYLVQPKPEGIAQALLIAEEFVAGDCCALILGDNLIHGSNAVLHSVKNFVSGAVIFGYWVGNPQRYGVVEMSPEGEPVAIEEKPIHPRSNWAVPGFYLYDHLAPLYARKLKPSHRGELEITDLNLAYLREKSLHAVKMERGSAWLDSGTISSLHEASSYIRTIEKRTGVKIGCPEEAALKAGFITVQQYQDNLRKLPKCEYQLYLEVALEEFLK